MKPKIRKEGRVWMVTAEVWIRHGAVVGSRVKQYRFFGWRAAWKMVEGLYFAGLVRREG